MNMQRIAIGLTVINVILLTASLAQLHPANAQQPKAPSILRGTGLEITDRSGKVRASIQIAPPSTVDGKLYPETVLLRLIDSKGGPLIKLAAAEDGGAISISDETQGYIQLIARDNGGFIKIKNPDGKEREFKP